MLCILGPLPGSIQSLGNNYHLFTDTKVNNRFSIYSGGKQPPLMRGLVH